MNNNALVSTAASVALTALLLMPDASGSAGSGLDPLASVDAARDCAASLGRFQALAGAELGQELEILSWNIQKAGSAGWAEDLARFADGVELAFIQEAALEAGIPSVLREPRYGFFAPGYTNARQETGVLTLSAGQPSLRCRLTAREPWLGTPKATSITEHPLRGREERLLAINLHAINFSLGLEDFGGQLFALEDLLAAHRGPVILAGDLNTWSSARERLVQTFLSRHDLRAVEFTPDHRTRAFGRALDHLFVRGLEADAAWVVPVDSSDHNPLRARLRVSAAP